MAPSSTARKCPGSKYLKPGDELTVGAVTLRVAKIGQAIAEPASPDSKPKAADTAVLEAIAAEPEQEEFEMEFDDGDPEPEVEGIPLVDDDATPAKPKPPATKAASTAAIPAKATAPSNPGDAKDDDAVAQFLLDLKLDDEE